MSKAVLISIRPKWCEFIASGQKPVEVRKTKPNLTTPFKCYIYETLDKKYENIGVYDPNAPLYKNFVHYPGKVIGEFICGNIRPVLVGYIHGARLTYDEITNYLGTNGRGWGWAISDLSIYDKPKELSEFYRWWNDGIDIRPCQNGKRCQHLIYDYTEDCEACAIDFDGTDCPYLKVTRSPQSWCYVEEL